MAAYPRRTAPGWPLLATLGVHLLLAWSWRIAHPPAPDLRAERVIDLLPVLPPAPAAPRALPAPARPASPAAPSGARVRPRPPAAPQAAPDAIAPPADAPARVADPFALDAPAEPAQSGLDAMVGKARRDAGIIDRELRKGKPGVPEEADTPWARFRRAVEGAHKDRGLAITSESYTTPDGQVIYRFRRGGRYFCRSSGGVPPKIGGAVGGGEVLFDAQGGEGRAGQVRCPGQAEWKRD